MLPENVEEMFTKWKARRRTQDDMLFPVLVHPSQIDVDVEPEEAQLRIYNPFTYPLRYEVDVNNGYFIIDRNESESTLGPRSYVDVRISWDKDLELQSGPEIKFRVLLRDVNSNELVGRRFIKANISSAIIRQQVNEETQEIEDEASSVFTRKEIQEDTQEIEGKRGRLLILLLALFFLLAVALRAPLDTDVQDENSSYASRYFRLSFDGKLIVSYLLGMVSVLLFNNVFA